MEWFKTPSSGADTSPVGWNSEGTTLNGDGYAFGSFGSHKVYQFDWGSSNAREVAQRMKSYADGTYGRGYIYFVDPTLYELNILPAAWADPSMGIDYEGNAASAVEARVLRSVIRLYGLEASGVTIPFGVTAILLLKVSLSSIPLRSI